MNAKILSSRVTVLYKLILPIFWIVVTLLIWVMAIALQGEPDAEALVVIGAIFTGLFLFLMLPPMFVNKVSYDDNNMYINNFRNEKSIPLQQVYQVDRWMFYFYRICYKDKQGNDKSVLLLPSFLQRIEAMMGMPANLEEFEDVIKKKN